MTSSYIPEWASHELKGSIPVKSCLPTKDGRRCGNAVVFHIGELHGQKTWWVITESRNIMRFTHGELAELFHQPKYACRDYQPHLRPYIEEELALL